MFGRAASVIRASPRPSRPSPIPRARADKRNAQRRDRRATARSHAAIGLRRVDLVGQFAGPTPCKSSGLAASRSQGSSVGATTIFAAAFWRPVRRENEAVLTPLRPHGRLVGEPAEIGERELLARGQGALAQPQQAERRRALGDQTAGALRPGRRASAEIDGTADGDRGRSLALIDCAESVERRWRPASRRVAALRGGGRRRRGVDRDREHAAHALLPTVGTNRSSARSRPGRRRARRRRTDARISATLSGAS